MLILVFSVILGLLPAGGMAAAGAATGTFDPLYMILPLASLTLATLAGYTRHVRNAMVDALSMEHIKTAMTKGATPLRVLFIHALPVAMLPVTTLIALDLGTLMGGAVITESLFSWPGMGRLIYDSILGNDYNVALISLLFVTIMILIGNLLADIGYTWLDPRIRLGADRT